MNEEKNLRDCLLSLNGFDDIHLLDSGSTDQTQQIARELGIPVSVNQFQGFGAQRNWAIDNIQTKYDWQFHIDADERMTPALAAELQSISNSNSPQYGGFHVPSKLMFAGQWLKRAGQYPGYQVRFFHKTRLRFENYGHGQREVCQLPLGKLKEPMIHYGFSKGIDAWFAKHIVYARREAEQAFSANSNGTVEAGKTGLFSGNSIERRRALKRLVSRLPGRYPLRLAYMLFIKRAILDGWAGVTYSHMLATYEGMIDVYLRLLRHGIHSEKSI